MMGFPENFISAMSLDSMEDVIAWTGSILCSHAVIPLAYSSTQTLNSHRVVSFGSMIICVTTSVMSYIIIKSWSVKKEPVIPFLVGGMSIMFTAFWLVYYMRIRENQRVYTSANENKV